MRNKYGEKLTKFSIRFYKEDGTYVSTIVDYFLSSKEAWEYGRTIKGIRQWINVSKG